MRNSGGQGKRKASSWRVGGPRQPAGRGRPLASKKPRRHPGRKPWRGWRGAGQVLLPAPGPLGGKGSEERALAGRSGVCGRRRSAAGAGGRGTGRGEPGREGGGRGCRGGPRREEEGMALTADRVEGGLGPPLEALAQLQRVLLLVQRRARRAVHVPSPVPSPPLPSRPGRSLPLLRALPPGALPGAECSRESAPGPPAAGTAGRGEARRGPWTEQGLLCPRRGRGSPKGRPSEERWEPGAPRPPGGRAGGAFPAGIRGAAVAAPTPTPLREQLSAGSRFPGGRSAGLHRGITCLRS